MNNSNFGNSNGWPDEGVTFTTARDLATLARATIETTPDLYKKFYTQDRFHLGQDAGRRAIRSPRAIAIPCSAGSPGADGLKTGHTEEAGYGFTGSAEQNGRRLIMVVAGLDSFNQRIEESVKFMDWGFRAWKSQPLFAKGRKIADAQVQLGDSATVGPGRAARPRRHPARRHRRQHPGQGRL